MTLDLQLFYLLNNLAGQSRILDFLFIFLAEYLAYVLVAIFVILLFFSAYEKKEKIKIFFVTFISAIISRFVLVEIIRIFYHRPRPFITHNVHQLITDSAWSFPSGHAAFFFAMATAIYFYNKKWGIGFFIGAILITISRVIAGVHYPSDIIGGMVVGILTACVVFYLGKWRFFDKIA